MQQYHSKFTEGWNLVLMNTGEVRILKSFSSFYWVMALLDLGFASLLVSDQWLLKRCINFMLSLEMGVILLNTGQVWFWSLIEFWLSNGPFLTNLLPGATSESRNSSLIHRWSYMRAQFKFIKRVGEIRKSERLVKLRIAFSQRAHPPTPPPPPKKKTTKKKTTTNKQQNNNNKKKTRILLWASLWLPLTMLNENTLGFENSIDHILNPKNCHPQKDRNLVFKTNYRLMQVKSTAECKGAFGNTVDFH